MITVDMVKKSKLIAIFRNIPSDKIEHAADAVYRGGIHAFEITFDPSDADTVCQTARAIEMVRHTVGADAVIGAGTVVRPDYVRAAHEAGAQFIVAPNTDEEVMKLTRERGLLSVPGTFTPTEMVRAYQLGADIVKVFPVLPDNIAYLRTILSPLSYIPFMPTGGVNLGNVTEFLKLGAVAVGAGATILTPDAVSHNDWSAIEANARAFMDKIG